MLVVHDCGPSTILGTRKLTDMASAWKASWGMRERDGVYKNDHQIAMNVASRGMDEVLWKHRQWSSHVDGEVWKTS